MYRVQASDAALLKEFRDIPAQQRSLELNRLLNRLRMESVFGKHMIVATLPGKEWAIGKTGQKRGTPIQLGAARYISLKDAQWALLRIRWETHSGQPWPVELD